MKKTLFSLILISLFLNFNGINANAIPQNFPFDNIITEGIYVINTGTNVLKSNQIEIIEQKGPLLFIITNKDKNILQSINILDNKKNIYSIVELKEGYEIIMVGEGQIYFAK